MGESALNSYFESLTLAEKLERLDRMYELKQDFTERELATSKWLCTGTAALIIAAVAAFDKLQNFGMPRFWVFAALGALLAAFICFLQAHYGFLDIYRDCGRFRMFIASGEASMFPALQRDLHRSSEYPQRVLILGHFFIFSSAMCLLSGSIIR